MSEETKDLALAFNFLKWTHDPFVDVAETYLDEMTMTKMTGERQRRRDYSDGILPDHQSSDNTTITRTLLSSSTTTSSFSIVASTPTLLAVVA